MNMFIMKNHEKVGNCLGKTNQNVFYKVQLYNTFKFFQTYTLFKLNYEF